MIRTIAVTPSGELLKNLSIQKLISGAFRWYWIDFNVPSDEEIELLKEPLRFHPLSIEDCIHTLQRPKLDYYDDYHFFVFQALDADSMTKEEVDLFLGSNYVVTFHNENNREIDDVWKRLEMAKSPGDWSPSVVLYHVLDKIVDNYFPHVYKIEDLLNDIDENFADRSMEEILEDLFDTRHELLSLRHTITPMRDLVYRMINSHRLAEIIAQKEYFADIHDHLLRLAEKVDASRELTTDMRDSYLSINFHETNRVMKVLTVITTIFMPLTFIAGIYGMNFKNMPELNWTFGYFGALFTMFFIGITMFLWFRKKGWFK
ncbi:magnesium/cobalt transporter CorA [Mesobacillus subterraneus]|jgi:magnesium transporter|uniref:magnesium/cobalt transporter CorA n=1 Tax=Mesobacillus subterraneus TaxID=285983 RepID=UPI00203A8C85|nr:magnesium/cobalt transporter CorA [Mesobacillus subterraneus]MCM3664874.1 magnesium/cobalt transporter CorA [Mesobacillus subterraneus]MCM3681963.1 magnesium/cobalt transporter CorA [Mesobacillus subterraneus]